MNSGLKTFGWRLSATLNDRPASTSLRTSTITAFSFLTSVCSSSTNSARRIVMPDDTIVASWREKTARSLSVIRSNSVMLISRERCFSAISRITRPRARS